MAEIDVAKLPITPASEFTSNDHFLIVNDAKAQQLSRSTVQNWIQTTMRGAKGEQGVAGADGRNGTNGTNGVSAQHSWNGTTLTITSASGTSSSDLKGTNGENGTNGGDGWTPTLAVVSDGDRRVQQVVGWFGGDGDVPEIGQYLSNSGFVSDISQATDIRGSQGVQGLRGEKGEQGEQGESGVDGKTIAKIDYNPDNSINIVYSDQTEVDSDVPNRFTGWASYKDSAYTQASPFTISSNTDTVLPNNSSTVVSNYPSNITSFYNSANQKYLLSDENGCYTVRIKMKVSASDVEGYLNVTFSKDTTDTPYSEDFPLRGDSKVQELNIESTIYGDSVLASNGMTVRLNSGNRPVSIHSIESVIVKTV